MQDHRIGSPANPSLILCVPPGNQVWGAVNCNYKPALIPGDGTRWLVVVIPDVVVAAGIRAQGSVSRLTANGVCICPNRRFISGVFGDSFGSVSQIRIDSVHNEGQIHRRFMKKSHQKINEYNCWVNVVTHCQHRFRETYNEEAK